MFSFIRFPFLTSVTGGAPMMSGLPFSLPPSLPSFTFYFFLPLQWLGQHFPVTYLLCSMGSMEDGVGSQNRPVPTL